MRSARPPKVARWLLEHFGSSPNNSAIVGDLDERYQHGRSRIWYGKEAQVALVMSFFQEVWGHKLLAVRALLIGWAVKETLLNILGVYGGRYLRFHYEPFVDGILFPLIWIMAPMGTSWIIARTHRSHARSMVLLYTAVELILAAITAPSIAMPSSSGRWTLLFWFSQTWISIVMNGAIVRIFVYFRIFSTILTLWMSTGIVIVTLLLGAGCFRATVDADPDGLKSASA